MSFHDLFPYVLIGVVLGVDSIDIIQGTRGNGIGVIRDSSGRELDVQYPIQSLNSPLWISL